MNQEEAGSIPPGIKFAVVLAAFLGFAGLSWYVYQRISFPQNATVTETNLASQSEEDTVEFTDQDTLRYNNYVIVRTKEAVDTSVQLYSVLISKNSKIVYEHPEGVETQEFNQVALVSLLGDTTRQLVIQQYSGGAHCCWSSWVLTLSDSVRHLYDSNEYPEIGDELKVKDLDGNSVMELGQTIIAFDYFDRLSHADSPGSPVYFKFSRTKRKYVLANREFASFVLAGVSKTEAEVRAMADTVKFATWNDPNGEYLSLVLQVVMNYAFAGEREKAWKFFDTWYNLADKAEMKKKIDEVFAESLIYQELYGGKSAENS